MVMVLQLTVHYSIFHHHKEAGKYNSYSNPMVLVFHFCQYCLCLPTSAAAQCKRTLGRYILGGTNARGLLAHCIHSQRLIHMVERMQAILKQKDSCCDGFYCKSTAQQKAR